MRQNPSAPVKRAASGVEWLVPVAIGISAVVIVLLVWMAILGAEHTAGWGFDFRAYYDAAVRFVATGTPYQAETLDAPFRPGPSGLYLYTPMPALLMVPLTWLGMAPATMTWLLLRLGLLAATCALMPVPRWVKLATLGVSIISAEFLFDLNLGNVSLIVTFLAVVAWRWLDRPVSGLAIAGSLAVRPAMGVIWVWWLIRRKWQPAAWVIVGLGAMFLVSLPLMGINPWFEYVRVLRNVSDVMGVERNLDFGSTGLALGFSEPVSNMFLFAGFVLAVGAIVLGLRRDREIGYVVTLMATLLLSPLLWDHYLTNLIVPAALLASRGRRFGVLLPLLGWLPLIVLPFVVAAGMLLPFMVPDRGEPALALRRNEPESIPDADPSLSGAPGA